MTLGAVLEHVHGIRGGHERGGLSVYRTTAAKDKTRKRWDTMGRRGNGHGCEMFLKGQGIVSMGSERGLES